MIAISYRRDDSLPIAGRLYDRLQAKFGKQNVFMDFDSIPPGVDFREQIKQTIERSKLVIAVIGPRWLGEQGGSSRRIDDPADFVRLEIKYALEQGVPIIPLLVDNTLMPRPEKLPPDIEGLAFRNALPLDSGLDFHNHAQRLINGICGLVGVSEMQGADAADAESKHSAAKQPNKRVGLLVAVGVLVGIAAIGGWYFGFFQNFGKARSVVTSVDESQASPKISAAAQMPAPTTAAPLPSASATVAASGEIVVGTSPSSALEGNKPVTETRAAPAGPTVNANTVYEGTIHVKNDSSTNVPLAITFGSDLKSGTMSQSSKHGDTVVKFHGVWDGKTLRAVTGELVSKPKNIQWKPESFTLRFSDDGKSGVYECDSEGRLYAAELSPR